MPLLKEHSGNKSAMSITQHHLCQMWFNPLMQGPEKQKQQRYVDGVAHICH